MKSFRQVLGEVAQPKPEEERAFKDMHSYETMPHPVALDHQFTGAIGADDLPREKAKRIADQEGDANYDTAYDDAFEYAGPSFAEEAIARRIARIEESKMAKAAALSKASATSKSGKAKVSLKKAPWDKNEEVELDENKNLIKDYEKYVSQGNKKDHNAIDYLMSMPKYKRMSKDQMAKIIGDHKRKGIFREDKLDEGFSPKQIEQLKKAYASMPDRVPMDMANKMSAVLKGRSKEELIAIARADIKWLSTTAATTLIMQGVKAKEING